MRLMRSMGIASRDDNCVPYVCALLSFGRLGIGCVLVACVGVCSLTPSGLSCFWGMCAGTAKKNACVVLLKDSGSSVHAAICVGSSYKNHRTIPYHQRSHLRIWHLPVDFFVFFMVDVQSWVID